MAGQGGRRKGRRIGRLRCRAEVGKRERVVVRVVRR